jgi:zinc transporter ZupT
MDESTKSVLILKICFIFVIFLVSMIAGIVPMKWKKCRKNEHFLGIANTFSGGVFLAIAFVHIIPEANSLYYEYKYSESNNGGNSTSIESTMSLPY